MNLFLIPLGTFVYFIFLKIKFNDFFKVFNVEADFGRQLHLNIFESIKNALKNLISIGVFDRDFILPFFEFSLPIIFLFLSIYIYLKIDKGYGLLGIFFLIPTFLGNQFMSGNRLVIVIFPVYILLSIISQKYKILEICIYIIFPIMLAIFALAYTHQSIFVG